MKNLLKMCFMLAFVTISFTACRDNKKTVNGVEMNKDADVKVKDDGQKIKMEDENKKVKIKKDENGNIEKKKVEQKDNE